MQLRPAIDIIDGKCVRLTQGDYNRKKVYNENPLEVAKEFEGEGFTNLHLVDLDGAKSKHIVNYNVLEQIAGKTNLSVDFGGGLKSDEDVRIAFNSGAAQLTGGSIAVQEPALFRSWLAKYGSAAVILGADARDRKVSISGWKEDTTTDVCDFVKGFAAEGVTYVISTDIASDGAMKGPSFELYKDLLGLGGELKIIASGGVATLDDLIKLRELGCFGAIIGKALYEGTIDLKELSREFIQNAN